MNTHTALTSVSLAAVALAGLTTAASGEPAQHKPRWTEQSRVIADVDGDGRLDIARQLTRGETGTRSRIQVRWATGGTAAVGLPYTGYERLEVAIDLDRDGSQELVLSGSGGESSWWQVVAEDGHELSRARTTDADGDPTPLAVSLTEGTGAPWNTTWQTDLLADGFYGYRFVASHPDLPATIKVRRWELSGRTLTRSANSEPGCYGMDGYLGVTLGAC